MYGFFANLNAMLAGTWMLFLSLFLMLVGGGLQGSLLGIRGSDEGFSTFALSLISTGFYAGYFAGSMLIPNLLRRVGYIRMFAALVAVASVAAVGYAMYLEQFAWVLMRIMTGFCFAGIYMITESWLNSQSRNDNRAKVLGVYLIVMFSGLSAGQILLNFGDIDGYFLFALGSIIISLASVPLLLTKNPAPQITESAAKLTIISLFKRSPLGTVSAFFANFLNGSIVGVSAIYAKLINLPTESIALFVASAYIGVIFLQFPIGYLSDRMDRRRVIVALFTLTLIVSLLLMQPLSVPLLILGFGLLGGLALPLYAVSIAYVNDRLSADEILPATSALLKISGMANMIAPILVGSLMVKFGNQWFFGAMTVAASVVVIFGIYRIIHGPDIVVDEQSEYTPIGANATPAAMAIVNASTQLAFDFDKTEETTEEEMP